MRLIIFGPQGAGKGTQSALISQKYGVPAISTGEIFRWAVTEGSDLGHEVASYMTEGRLVPDDLTIKVVSERLSAEDCAAGFLLDGFPRNLKQATALDELLAAKDVALNAALVLEVPHEVSLRRITGRLMCASCGAGYHLDAPPETDGVCDNCGGDVVRRGDDVSDATVRTRLEVYHAQTEPLKKYYEDKGILRIIDGMGTPDEVFARVATVV
ncbi:MAG TPA: adenylate kinase [Actinomycetota bacterium]|nr:adenylate kinase [Actinomycetota bacterium]